MITKPLFFTFGIAIDKQEYLVIFHQQTEERVKFNTFNVSVFKEFDSNNPEYQDIIYTNKFNLTKPGLPTFEQAVLALDNAMLGQFF